MSITQKLSDDIKNFIDSQNLIPRDSSVLIALSGGVDSVALTYLLYKLKDRLSIKKLGCCHYNHNLRGKDSDDDEIFCRNLCEKLSLPFYSEKLSVKSQKIKLSKQEYYRKKRYSFFDKTAQEEGFDLIATAHTAWDVAENTLMRLFSGSGIKGLTGIASKNKNIIRPIINIRKDMLYNITDESGLGYRLDKSNLKTDYKRNAVRHIIIPSVEKVYPAYLDAVLRFTEILKCENSFLDDLTADLLSRAKSDSHKFVSLDINCLINYHEALIRRAVIKCAEDLGVKLLYSHVSDILKSVKEKTCGTKDILNFEGLKIVRSYEKLLFIKKQGGEDKEVCHTLEAGKEYNFYAFKISVFISESDKILRDIKNPDIIVFDFDKLNFPLMVRSFINGDRIKTGKTCSKKLKDIFIDEKVAKDLRVKMPVISGKGNVAALFFVNKDGFLKKRTSPDYYVDKNTVKTLVLEFKIRDAF
jgi:tRNA(Ile)-lysidine synthase